VKGRRRAFGAELDARGVSFRVFAPGRAGVDVVVDDGRQARVLPLEPDDERGAWSGHAEGVRAGARYRYRLAGEPEPLPDPTSRFQPEGVAGPSEVIDPAFAWTDADFPGIGPRGRVVYELHIGTFTPEGTWQAARARLPELARLGVSVLEVMPVAEFAGARGWGYDAVFWHAPYHHYGRPEDMRRFVDEAHRYGLGVILDVVYNHLGIVGNVLPRYSPDYMSQAPNEWGGGLAFDETEARPIRGLVMDNVAYWIDEFHVDGYRFDAIQGINDRSRPHILAEAVAAAREAGGNKILYLVGEDEPQDSRLLRPLEAGGAGLDTLWNDDLHHAARVAITGHREAYFMDYTGTARELAACVRHGFLFQGQRTRWHGRRRGHGTRGLPPRAFVTFLENHDQIANEGLGERMWPRVSPGRLRALKALLLLAPWTPLLFQGEEWNATARFAYFADHDPEQAALVKAGRARQLQQFPRHAGADERDRFPDPGAPETFAACKLDWSERSAPAHARAYALHRDLLELRHGDPTLRREGTDGVVVDAAALSEALLVVRWFGVEEDGASDRLLLLNLGADLEPRSVSEPLVAPPRDYRWRLTWSSDHTRYGGAGARGPREDRELFAAGEAAVFLSATPGEEPA
jgi:maltooligosyltrehalose trehalohydrolase